MQRFNLKDGKLVKKPAGKYVRFSDAEEMIEGLRIRVSVLSGQMFERQASLQRIRHKLDAAMRACQGMHTISSDLAGDLAAELVRINRQPPV